MGFQMKPELFRIWIEEIFKNFSNLMLHSSSSRQILADNDLKILTNHLQKFQDNFSVRFEDIRNISIPV